MDFFGKAGKALAVLCLCHQRPDRSFFFHGKQFPVCARCMGLLLGYAAGVVLAVLTKGNGYKIWWVLVLPMLVDGVLQLVWNVESNNIRRVITGFLAGNGNNILFYFCAQIYGMVGN